MVDGIMAFVVAVGALSAIWAVVLYGSSFFEPIYRAITGSVPGLLQGSTITARVLFAAILTIGTLLAACSGSNRVERIVPAWANTPPRSETQPMPQYEAQTGSVGRSNPDVKPQEAKKSAPPSPPPQEAKQPASPAEE
jgi:hypothetical protein